jgi:tRNA-guanine family transglycosylase
MDGSAHLLTPESSMEIQRLLGSDIVMAFDECTPYPADATARASMELSMRWAARSRAAFGDRPGPCAVRHPAGQHLSRPARRKRRAAARHRL